MRNRWRLLIIAIVTILSALVVLAAFIILGLGLAWWLG